MKRENLKIIPGQNEKLAREKGHENAPLQETEILETARPIDGIPEGTDNNDGDKEGGGMPNNS